jgi:hypothetical protein
MSIIANAQNLVEPLSNGLKLSMTKQDIVGKFGSPTDVTWDDRSFGYDNFFVMVGGQKEEIWHLTLKKNIRFNCGVGIGSSKADVQKYFGSSADELTYDQYKIYFYYSGNVINKIKIDPANSSFVPVAVKNTAGSGSSSNINSNNKKKSGFWERFGDALQEQSQQSSSPKTNHSNTSSSNSFIGSWYGIAQTTGLIVIKANGTYEYQGSNCGTYTVSGNNIVFKGCLASWNNGKASLDNGSLVFYWQNSNGSYNYFTFGKSN